MGAYYRAAIAEFLQAEPRGILGELTQAQTGTTREQRRAWEEEVALLQTSLRRVCTSTPGTGGGGLLLEYQMYRLQRRLDAVLLAADLILVIEFKMGAEQYDASGVAQVEDYALDLRDFHDASQSRRIVPILCCSEAPKLPPGSLEFVDGVSSTLRANADSLADVIRDAYEQGRAPSAKAIDLDEWDRAAYRPVPSIIEAAEMLYSAHSVEDIHASLAGEKNLTATTDRLIEIIEDAERRRARAICFVTGVPGSGKTLTGLNAVHDPRFRGETRSSGAFLSGNTPLVEVLREALARDYRRNEGGTLSAARRKTKAEIQLLMNFLEEYLEHNPDRPPHEHVIVFDEAQRAWDASYGKKKFGRAASEPVLFLEIMARHADWCVIIGLVGGGQEINRGEGGLEEWGAALSAFDTGRSEGKAWEIHASPHVIEGTEVTAGGALFPEGLPSGIEVVRDGRLHLPVSIRSHRCEVAAAWVNAVLDGKPDSAAELASSIDDFPIYHTRSLEEARSWLRRTTRGNRRCGLVASVRAIPRFGTPRFAKTPIVITSSCLSRRRIPIPPVGILPAASSQEVRESGCRLSPLLPRAATAWARQAYQLPERRACRVLGVCRAFVRYRSVRPHQEALRKRLKELARVRVRAGYEQLHVFLRREGWPVNHKRVYRLYTEEGLTLKPRRPKRHRSASVRKIRPMPARPNEQWAMDFMHDTLAGGQTIRLLTAIDLCTRECVLLRVGKGFTGSDVASLLSQVGEDRGQLPERIRVDNGTEFTSRALDHWAYWNQVALDFSRPGKPVDNCFIEAFNGTVRRECLSQHWFTGLEDAQHTLDAWREGYNNTRPHRSLANLLEWSAS